MKKYSNLSLRKDVEKYDLQNLAWNDHVKKNIKNLGAPRALSIEVEERLAKMIDELGEWDYLLINIKIKFMVKDI